LAAEQTGLTEAGARRALPKLVRTGLVEELGGGWAQRFQLRPDALTGHVRNLFRAERDRYYQLTRRLRELFGGLSAIEVAWVDSPPTKIGQPMHIGVLSDSRSLSYHYEQLRQRINEVERAFELTIELYTFSRPDVPDVPWDKAVLLAGHIQDPAPRGGPTHADRTDRASRISGLIAGMIQRNPTLVARAIRYK